MDPNLFHLDWERLYELLVAIIVAAFLMERAPSILFENRRYIDRLKNKDLKSLVRSQFPDANTLLRPKWIFE